MVLLYVTLYLQKLPCILLFAERGGALGARETSSWSTRGLLLPKSGKWFTKIQQKQKIENSLSECEVRMKFVVVFDLPSDKKQ